MTSITDLSIDQRVMTSLRKSRITSVAHILVLPKEELAAKAKISANDVTELLDTISKKLTTTKPCSVLDMWNNSCDENLLHTKLSFGCPIIDEMLHGGLLLPGINEISGESGSGKTQFALQLCLMAQFSDDAGGLQGGALFISTEDAFPTKRLHQLAANVKKKFGLQNINLMDSIYIEHAADVDDLRSLVKQRIPALLKNSNVRLIVIDSIAALFRVEYTMNEGIERSKALTEFGQHLHRISHSYNIAVLCINQISDVVSDDGKGEDIGGRRVVPALGLAWSNMVTMRIMVMRTPYTLSQLQRKEIKQEDDPEIAAKNNESYDPVVRKLRILFAPHIPNNECHYIVEEEGVRGIRLETT